MGGPILELSGVTRRFGEVTALAGLGFSVAAGEVFGLIGPDGAGKTTALRLIAGLMGQDDGRIAVLGHELPKAARRIRERMGYMPQSYSLYADLTVIENLEFFAGMYGVFGARLEARADRLLDIARLDPFRDRPAGALSGGMYKKLALACALTHAPELLLLDEPTNGVDPISRRELWTFLRELVDDGVAVVVSTPYMDEAERCDRVGLLVGGRLVAEGAPAALRQGFAFTVLKVEAEPLLAARDILARTPSVHRVYTVGRALHAVTPRDRDAAGLAAALGEAGIRVAAVTAVEPTFEDVFLDLAARAEEG